MRKGWLAPIGAVVVVVGIAFLARSLLRNETTPEQGPDAHAATPDLSTRREATPKVEVESAAPIASPARLAAPAPTPAEAAPAIPESYRRALCGIRGRLVEEDGKPVAGLGVELLEILPGALLGDFDQLFAKQTLMPPSLAIARATSGADGVFTLHGAEPTGFHGIGIDLGGARGTLRFLDRSLLSGEQTDLGDVVLAPFVTFVGKVEDADGKPVAGARVRASLLPAIVFQPGVPDVARGAAMLPDPEGRRFGPPLIEIPPGCRAWEEKLPFPTTRTQDDGTFKLAGVPQGLATLVVDAEGFTGTWRGPTPTGKKSERDVGTIGLSRGRTVTGTVVDVAGHPVQNADVIGGVRIDVAGFAIAFAASPTDAQGRFELHHLADQGGVLLAARPGPLAGWTASPVCDGESPVTLMLPQVFALDLRFAARDGTVVPEAEVKLRPGAGRNEVPLLTFNPPRVVPAERLQRIEEGHVRIEGLPAGSYEIRARAPGYALAHATVDLLEGPRELKLEFAPARDVAVRVVDAQSGAPVEHAEVEALASDRESPALVSRRTDADGRATLPALPAGPDDSVPLRAWHPAFAPLQFVAAPKLATPESPIEFKLSPGAALHVTVLSGGRPPADPVLFILEPQYDESRAFEDTVPRFGVPGADGTFGMRGISPGPHRWELMPRIFGEDPQRGFLEVAKVTTLRRGSVELAAGETAELKIELAADAFGAPAEISGILHVKHPDGASYRVMTSSYQRGAESTESRTVDALPNQPFRLEKIAPGQINFNVMSIDEQGHKMSQVYADWFELGPGEKREIVIDVDPQEFRAVMVDADGTPVEGANVWMNEVDPSSRQSKNGFGANSGPDGVATTMLPRPGTYRIHANQPKVGRASFEATIPTAAPLRIVLEAGVLCAGRIQFVGARPTGKSHYVNFVEGDDWEKQLGFQLADGEDRFDVKGLKPGHYRVWLFTSPQALQTEFDLPIGGDGNLVLRFEAQ